MDDETLDQEAVMTCSGRVCYIDLPLPAEIIEDPALKEKKN